MYDGLGIGPTMGDDEPLDGCSRFPIEYLAGYHSGGMSTCTADHGETRRGLRVRTYMRIKNVVGWVLERQTSPAYTNGHR